MCSRIGIGMAEIYVHMFFHLYSIQYLREIVLCWLYGLSNLHRLVFSIRSIGIVPLKAFCIFLFPCLQVLHREVHYSCSSWLCLYSYWGRKIYCSRRGHTSPMTRLQKRELIQRTSSERIDRLYWPVTRTRK